MHKNTERMRLHRIAVIWPLLLLFVAAAHATDCRVSLSSGEPTKWAESAYNRIFIYSAGPCVKMTFRRVGMEWDESVSNRADPKDLPVQYTRVLTIASAYPETIKKIAMLGVGGGSTLNYFSQYYPDADHIGVELDPEVLKFAKFDFGLEDNPRIRLAESDGRMFLMRSKDVFDIVILDAYRGGYVPSHMLTKEFYLLLRKRLSQTGVAAINLHYGTELFESSLRTIQEVFPTVHTFPAGGNVVVIAANSPIQDDQIRERATSRQQKLDFRFPLPEMLATRKVYFGTSKAQILTDDFSPANQLEQMKSINAERRW